MYQLLGPRNNDIFPFYTCMEPCIQTIYHCCRTSQCLTHYDTIGLGHLFRLIMSYKRSQTINKCWKQHMLHRICILRCDIKFKTYNTYLKRRGWPLLSTNFLIFWFAVSTSSQSILSFNIGWFGNRSQNKSLTSCWSQ